MIPLIRKRPLSLGGFRWGQLDPDRVPIPLRVAEVHRLDVNLSDDGQVLEYRARLKVSVKHETEQGHGILHGSPFISYASPLPIAGDRFPLLVGGRGVSSGGTSHSRWIDGRSPVIQPPHRSADCPQLL
jgi:hypothetical protein